MNTKKCAGRKISEVNPLQCLDFCIHQLEFNIYNKTNYMHRKNIKF